MVEVEVGQSQGGQEGPDHMSPGYVFLLPDPDPGDPSPISRGDGDILMTIGESQLEPQDKTA